MKPAHSVAYFPVDTSEQALLLRVREPDFAIDLPALVVMVGQLAEARFTPAELEQAIALLVESQQGKGLDARFDDLEARLRERIDAGLMEIEGRLSRWLGDTAAAVEPAAKQAPKAPTVPAKQAPKAPTVAAAKRAVDAAQAAKRTAAAPVKPAPAVVSAPAREVIAIPQEATIAFAIGAEVIWGASAAQFYIEVWRWLIAHRHVTTADLPVTSGRSRYVAARKPRHPNGKEFTRAEELERGFFIEVNLSRSDIIRRAKRYLAQHGIAFEVLVGSEP